MGGGANQWRAHKRWRPLRRARDTGAGLDRSRRRWRCQSRTRRVVLAIRMEGGGRWIWCGTLVHGLFSGTDIFLTKAGILTIFVELSLLMSTYRGNRLARVYKLINKHMHLKWRALQMINRGKRFPAKMSFSVNKGASLKWLAKEPPVMTA